MVPRCGRGRGAASGRASSEPPGEVRFGLLLGRVGEQLAGAVRSRSARPYRRRRCSPRPAPPAACCGSRSRSCTARLSSWHSSSMRWVPAGSSDAVGSSSSSTSGAGATARAMHSRCCCPPDSATALVCSRSFTSSHSAAWRSARSTTSSSSAPLAVPADAQARGHVVVDGHGGERRRALEHHAHPAPHGDGVEPAAVDVLAVEQHRPRHPAAVGQLVHAVQAAQERALAAARRADDGRHRVGREEQRHLLHGDVAAEQGGEPARFDPHEGVVGTRCGTGTSEGAPAPRAPAAADGGAARSSRSGRSRRRGPRSYRAP